MAGRAGLAGNQRHQDEDGDCQRAVTVVLEVTGVSVGVVREVSGKSVRA